MQAQLQGRGGRGEGEVRVDWEGAREGGAGTVVGELPNVLASFELGWEQFAG